VTSTRPPTYADVWRRSANVDGLNQSIHDNASPNELAARAHALRCRLFQEVYPAAAPRPGATILEVGSGVGWIMQAMLEVYEPVRVLGLDVSHAIARCGHERLSNPRATFLVYDGLRVPIAADVLPTIYSVSSLHHVEKHVAFLLFQELFRVLAPGGHAVLHLLSIHHAPRAGTSFEEECWNHVVGNTGVFWHHYYAFEELLVLFAELIGVDDLDVQPVAGDGYVVHFSKGTGSRFRRPELAGVLDAGRSDPVMLVRAREALEEVQASTSWRLTAPARRIMDRLRGR